MRYSILFGSAATFALAAAAPSLAEVTAEDVWANMQAPITALGGEMNAEATRNGNQLVIGETRISFALPFDFGSIGFSYSGMTLAENGDGTVSILYPDTMTGSFRADGPDGVLASATYSMNELSYTATASGTPGDVTYAYVLNSGTMALGELDIPEAPEMSIDLTAKMTGMNGTYRITEGDILQITADGESGELQYDMRMTDDLGIETRSSQTMSSGTNAASLSIPTGKVSILNLSQALRDGLAMTVQASGARLNVTSESFMEGESLMVQNYGYLMEDISYRIDKSGLVASGTNRDVWMDFLSGLVFPVPVKASAEAITGRLAMPLNRTEAPADASLGMTVEGLMMDEGLWAMFDPGAQLPRDPANLSLDMSGKIELLMDILDINALMAMGPEDPTPVLLHKLDLHKFDLDMVGAAVSAKGGFTFDNSDYDTFGGFPAPDGSVDVEVSGLNTLMDTLVAMGLLPEEQAMGTRMMLGMFAQPGDSEDSLVSTIEIKPDGQILANGQPLQ